MDLISPSSALRYTQTNRSGLDKCAPPLMVLTRNLVIFALTVQSLESGKLGAGIFSFLSPGTQLLEIGARHHPTTLLSSFLRTCSPPPFWCGWRLIHPSPPFRVFPNFSRFFLTPHTPVRWACSFWVLLHWNSFSPFSPFPVKSRHPPRSFPVNQESPCRVVDGFFRPLVSNFYFDAFLSKLPPPPFFFALAAPVTFFRAGFFSSFFAPLPSFDPLLFRPFFTPFFFLRFARSHHNGLFLEPGFLLFFRC